MTPQLNQLRDPTDYKGKAKVTVGNGHTLPILHTGYNSIRTLKPSQSLLLKDVLHVPDVTKNLLSISQFTRDNAVTLEFGALSCVIKDKVTKLPLLRGSLTNGLYKLDLLTSSSLNSSCQIDPYYQPGVIMFNEERILHLCGIDV